MKTYLLKAGVRQAIAKAGETDIAVAYNAKTWVDEYPAGNPQLMVTTPGGKRVPVTVETEDNLITGQVPNELLAGPGVYSYVFVWTSGSTQLESGRCECLVLGSNLAQDLVHDSRRTPEWAERIFLAAEVIEGAVNGAMEARNTAADKAAEAAESEANAAGSAEEAEDSAALADQKATAALAYAEDAAASAAAMHPENYVAQAFSASSAYSAGTYVMHDGYLYRLTADHDADVTWENTAKVQVKVADDVGDLKIAITINSANRTITFDEDSNGKYIGADGTIGTTEGFHYTNLLTAFYGHGTFEYSYSGSPISVRVHGYDATGAWVRQLGYAQSGSGSIIRFDVGKDIMYVRISISATATNLSLMFEEDVKDELLANRADFANSVIAGSPYNTSGSFQWYGPGGTSDLTGRIGLTQSIPVSNLAQTHLPDATGNYAIFILLPESSRIKQPSNQYLPFTVAIEMTSDDVVLAGNVAVGLCTNKSFNTNYSNMNIVTIPSGFNGGIYVKDTKYTKTYQTNEDFQWLYIAGSKEQLLKIKTLSLVPNASLGISIKHAEDHFTEVETDIDALETSVATAETNISNLQTVTRNADEQLTESIVFAGSDREYINGALTNAHVVQARRKCAVASAIPSSATGNAAAFFNIATVYRVDAVEGNYYPFTTFIHVAGGQELSGNGVWIYYSASGSAYVPNYANLISSKYTGKTSGYRSTNQIFNKTFSSGSTKLQYICVYGSVEDLRKIEYIEVVLNDFAASLDNASLVTAVAEMDDRIEAVESEIGGKLNDYSLIAYGDSLTQGAGTSSWTYNYTNQCKLALGAKNCINYGYGGSASAAIAFTAGALSGYIPPSVRSFALKYADLTTDITIALTQLNNKEVVIDGNTYTISQTGNTAYSLPSTYMPSDLWLPVRVKNSLNTADIYIIWIGTNDGEYKWDIIDAMIAKCQHKQYVVMGLTRLGTDTTVENEQIAYRKYGSHFFNTRIQIINNAFTILGMTPTAEDTTAMNSGLMPPSLLTDNVHFNDNGYTAIGKLLAKHIQSLGYSYQKAE